LHDYRDNITLIPFDKTCLLDRFYEHVIVDIIPTIKSDTHVLCNGHISPIYYVDGNKYVHIEFAVFDNKSVDLSKYFKISKTQGDYDAYDENFEIGDITNNILTLNSHIFKVYVVNGSKKYKSYNDYSSHYHPPLDFFYI
jgi:hypothetical protein